MSAAPLTGWVPDDSSLAARLALVRQRMKWTEAAAERACGLPKNKWSRLEDGKTARDTNEVVKRIADTTGVDLGWLAFGLRPNGLPLGVDPSTRCSTDNTRTRRTVVVGKRARRALVA